MVAGSRRHRASSAATFSETMTTGLGCSGGPGSTVAFSVAVDGRSAKDFELKHGEDKVIKVGRYPKSHVVLDHPGISNQHLELKLIPGYEGVAVRDVSSNGTGMQLAGSEEALRLEKDMDTPLPDGALILLPFHVKGSKSGATASALRAGLSVRVLNVPHDVLLGKDTGRSVAATETLGSIPFTRPLVELQQPEDGDASKGDSNKTQYVDAFQCAVDQQQLQGQQQHDLERQNRRREKRGRKEDRQKQERGRRRSKFEGKSREHIADDEHDRHWQAGLLGEQQELDHNHEDQSRAKRPRRSDKKHRRHSGRGESEKKGERKHQVREAVPQHRERMYSEQRDNDEKEAEPRKTGEILTSLGCEQDRQDHEDNERRDMDQREGTLVTLLEENTHQGQEEERWEISQIGHPNQDPNQPEQQWQEQSVEEYQKRECQEPLHRQAQEPDDRKELKSCDAHDRRERQDRQDMDCGEQEEQALEEREAAEYQEEVHKQAPSLNEDSFHVSEKESIDCQREEERQREREHAISYTHQEVVAADASKPEVGTVIVADYTRQEVVVAADASKPEVGTSIMADKPEVVGGSPELAPQWQSAGLLSPTMLPDIDGIKLAPEGAPSVYGGTRSMPDSSNKLVTAASSRRTGLDSSIKSAAPQASLPRWVALGHRLHWWSESQKKHFDVKVTKLDEQKRIVIATFESDSKVWKSVPYSQFGRSSCPLRPLPNSAQSEGQAAQADRTGPAVRSKVATAKDKKRERSRTPEWWQMENQKSLKEQAAERERNLQEQQRREQERLRDERRRKELMEAEQRKVQEAFEQRKREAEERRLREEEEWREGLRRQREQEAAEEALEMAGLREQDREERKQRRREEKEKAKREEIQERERILAEEHHRQQERPPTLVAVQANPCSGSHHTQSMAPPIHQPPAWFGPLQQSSWHGMGNGMGTGAAPWAHAGGPAWGWPNAALANPMYCQRPVPYQT